MRRPAVRAVPLTAVVFLLMGSALPLSATAGGGNSVPTPRSLRVTATATTSVSLAWANRSSTKIARYELYLNRVLLTTTPGVTYTFTGLTCGTSYSFGVDGVDSAGNRSQVAELTASTSQCSSGTPSPDKTPPSKPTGLAATSSTATSISLSWTSSTDNVGVTGYDVYRNGGSAGTTSAPTDTLGGLSCGTSYTIGVDAYDAASNHSAIASVTASTSACADATAPTAPTNLLPSGATASSVLLSWSASFDNVGVVGYDVLVNGGKAGSTALTTYTVGGLSCGTSYTISVDAYDAAGNRSQQTTLTTATSVCPPPPALSQSIAGGSSIAGAVSWSARGLSGSVSKVSFSIDGALKWTDNAAPFVFNGDGNALDTTTLSDGSHTFQVVASYADGTSASNTVSATVANAAVTPPPRGGYFSLQPVGSSSSLPSGSACARMVHRSPWEPRPVNFKRNHVMPDPAVVHAAFAARPLAVDGNYDSRWDTWLLPRVDGQFTGTTDEIFQWAACKWGLSDDVLRAIAVRESTWYQYLTYPSGRPVNDWGSGDMVTTPNAATTTFCNALAQYGYDYQTVDGPGMCPKTFSIVGVMSWEDPAWGQMPDNQNGTFPFNRDSTAFAVDYLAADLRGCYEGWEHWLGSSYAAGDIWGCVGSWYAGDWHSADADGYISRVKNELANFTWLQPDWPSNKPSCSATYGCPGPDPM